MADLILSEKEQQLLDFIEMYKKEPITIKVIEDKMGKEYVGALGRLLGKELIVAKKKRGTDSYNAYGVKYIKYYKIKNNA